MGPSLAEVWWREVTSSKAEGGGNSKSESTRVDEVLSQQHIFGEKSPPLICQDVHSCVHRFELVMSYMNPSGSSRTNVGSPRR